MRGIREVAVVGIPDELLGQAIRAHVVLVAGVSLTDKEIRAHCAARLENFMVPKEIILCADLPRTATGKVSKKALLASP
jgi:long-chain acyl-CoA synthetase